MAAFKQLMTFASKLCGAHAASNKSEELRRRPTTWANCRTEWRPKNQVFVMRCYPDVGSKVPNASDLAHLLYYAYSRPGKLEKVGPFLLRRVRKDLAKKNWSGVEVTRQILEAIIAHNPNHLHVWSQSVIQILFELVHSNNSEVIWNSASLMKTITEYKNSWNFPEGSERRQCYDKIVTCFIQYAGQGSDLGEHSFRKAGLRGLQAFFFNTKGYSEDVVCYDPAMKVILENPDIIRSDRANLTQLNEWMDTLPYGNRPNGTTVGWESSGFTPLEYFYRWPGATLPVCPEPSRDYYWW